MIATGLPERASTDFFIVFQAEERGGALLSKEVQRIGGGQRCSPDAARVDAFGQLLFARLRVEFIEHAHTIHQPNAVASHDWTAKAAGSFFGSPGKANLERSVGLWFYFNDAVGFGCFAACPLFAAAIGCTDDKATVANWYWRASSIVAQFSELPKSLTTVGAYATR